MSREKEEGDSRSGTWARLRFSIIGGLLASPPKRGELKPAVDELAIKEWRHPVTGESKRFAVSTIERWYYAAKAAQDPIGKLRSKVRKDAGSRPSLVPQARELLKRQYEAHPSWSYQLHSDNLETVLREKGIEPVPSYASVRRYLKANGLLRQKRLHRRDTEGARRAAARAASLETRSYEAEYVNGLWHLDFHEGSRRVVLASGEWRKPNLLCVIDDRSRLVCHLQWYLDVTVEVLVHGLSQALQKRGLPRALMTDNGSAMKAAEFVEGLEGESGLSIAHEPTLDYSPQQNGKQENFFGRVEGRLMAMLDGEDLLSLELLNQASQAWVELDYHRTVHSETKQTPLERFLAGPDVGRPCPSSDALRRHFKVTIKRHQRRSDGTVSILGKRFEVPSRYRTMQQLVVRCARFDLRTIDLVDPRTRELLCELYPLDKAKNADGERRSLTPLDGPLASVCPAPSGIAPLLKKLMAEYAATGLPPAYLPKDDTRADQVDDDSNDDEAAGVVVVR